MQTVNAAIERYLREWQDYDPYEGYLTADELCQQSGLDPGNLSKLREARLLLPDTKDGRYRLKLAGWGKKLAYLLREGWGRKIPLPPHGKRCSAPRLRGGWC
jgi:hypothetical protein